MVPPTDEVKIGTKKDTPRERQERECECKEEENKETQKKREEKMEKETYIQAIQSYGGQRYTNITRTT